MIYRYEEGTIHPILNYPVALAGFILFPGLVACKAGGQSSDRPIPICQITPQPTSIPSVTRMIGTNPIKRPLSVIAFHGSVDEIVLYEGTGIPELINQDVGVWPPNIYWVATCALRNKYLLRSNLVYHETGVTGESCPECKACFEVILYTIEVGGHDWPRQDWPIAAWDTDYHTINASELMCSFLRNMFYVILRIIVHTLVANVIPTNPLPV